MTIQTKIIADSIANDIRITTLQTRAPKFLDAEFEKHRMLSSNSSSDRAIPILKALDNGYFLPDDVRMNQPGMQGDLLLDEESKEEFWNDLKDLYGYTASVLKKWSKVHKQHLNRYLMGFAWQNKVVTATEWDNFFKLRLDEAADPAMYQLAKTMKDAMDGGQPVPLEQGQWHLPYADRSDSENCDGVADLIKCSVARCARVSYNNHDNTTPDISRDLELYDKLLTSGHLSPFEHQATPMREKLGFDVCDLEYGVTQADVNGFLWSANFFGWIQYRKLIDGWGH